MRKSESVVATLINGAIAGAVATWVMGKVTTQLYEREDKSAREREDQARGGETAYGIAAQKAADAAGVTLSKEKRQKAGEAIHWALGVGAGATYALVRRRFDAVGKAAGLGFGTGFWLLMDELAVPLAGLTPGPKAFPWQTHARGLAGHLSFGLVTDTTLRVLDAVT
jgi:uncharacterized membrane protein YagU involved in acid resistance